MNEWLQTLNELMRRLLFLPEQASTFATRVDRLHYFVFAVTMVSSVGIGLPAVYFFFRYRERQKNASTPDGRPQRALRERGHRHPAVLLPRLGVRRVQGLHLVHEPAQGRDGRLRDGQEVDVAVRLSRRSQRQRHADRARPPAGAPADDQPRRDPLVLRARVPHQAGRASPAATPRPGSRPPRPGATGSTAPNIAAPGTRRWSARWWCCEPAEFDEWMARQQAGPGRPGRHQRRRRVRPGDFRGDLVAHGQRLAAVQGCFKCHSVDGPPHIGPTWIDLYRRPTTLQSGADHHRRRGLPDRIDDGAVPQDGEGVSAR